MTTTGLASGVRDMQEMSSAQPSDPDLTERPSSSASGIPYLVVEIVLVVVGLLVAVAGIATAAPIWWVLFAVLAVAFLIILAGFYMLSPNEAAVLTFFGAYRGTDRGNGLRIANPLYMSAKVSLRIRNFNTTTSKVNDANGNRCLLVSECECARSLGSLSLR